MKIRPLEETAVYVETTVATLPVQATSAAEMLDLYLEVSIQVLDSESSSYPRYALETCLREFLIDKERFLDLIHGPYPQQK
jgi:hypothetical protein